MKSHMCYFSKSLQHCWAHLIYQSFLRYLGDT
uniref:Uncharacterized protein n=1 Tax=Arundo donax TaxID=35708 RepID=A0A0A9BBK0_ARUDO